MVNVFFAFRSKPYLIKCKNEIKGDHQICVWPGRSLSLCLLAVGWQVESPEVLTGNLQNRTNLILLCHSQI